MKQFLIFLLSVVPLICTAQYPCNNRAFIGAGIMAGYSSKQTAVGEMYVAAKLTEHIILYPVSFKVHFLTEDSTIPVIFEPRLGYKFNHTEVYGGYGYHFAGSDGHKEYNKYRGFRPGAGVIHHLNRFLTIMAGVSGNVYCGTIGYFAFR